MSKDSEAKVQLSKKDVLKALATATAQLKKKHGNDLIVDTENQKFEGITSGSQILDDAIGNGGIVNGKIYTIYGEASSGKCLTADMMILTPNGYMSVEEIFHSVGLPLEAKEEVVPVQYQLINEYNEPEFTTAFTYNGLRSVKHIYTSTQTHSVTYNHPLRTLNLAGTLQWKNAEYLEEGDYLIKNKIKFDPEYFKQLSLDLDYYHLGFLITSEYLQGRDEFVSTVLYSERIENKFRKIFGQNGYSYCRMAGEWRFKSELLKQVVFQAGLGDNGLLSQLPLFVRTAQPNQKLSFLAGYLDQISSNNAIDYKVDEQIVLMFEEFGFYVDHKLSYIHPTEFEKIRTVFHNSTGLEYVYKNIDPLSTQFDIPLVVGNTLIRLIDILPTYPEIKNDYINRVLNSVNSTQLVSAWKEVNSFIEQSYESQYITSTSIYQTTHLMFESLIYDPIVSVEYDSALYPTYDFSMEHTASFILNGIRSHNTSIANSIVAQYQKQYPDKLVLYIDAEQAYSIEYAQSFGVKTTSDDMIFIQDSCAETVMDVIDTYVSTGGISLVVLDSIPALSTLAQLEKGYDEKTMASLAGVLSPSLTKLKSVLAKFDVPMIMINQTRNSMSMYGSPTTMPGGKAVRFYSSVILHVTKRDTIVDSNKQIVGQELQLKFEKNKLATPFKIVNTKLYFHKGFSVPDEVAEMAVTKNLIERAGAWFSWVGSKGQQLKCQGAAGIVKILKESDEELEYLQVKLKELGTATSTLSADEIAQIKQVEEEEGDEE